MAEYWIYIWIDPFFPLIVWIVNDKCDVNVNRFDIFRSFRFVHCSHYLRSTRLPVCIWNSKSPEKWILETCYSLVRSFQSLHGYRYYQMYYMLQFNILFGVETSFLTISFLLSSFKRSPLKITRFLSYFKFQFCSTSWGLLVWRLKMNNERTVFEFKLISFDFRSFCWWVDFVNRNQFRKRKKKQLNEWMKGKWNRKT